MRRVAFIALGLLLAGICSTAKAQSPQSLPSVNLGYTSFLDGAPPAGPGLYWAQYEALYTADRIKGSNGQTLGLPNPDLDAWISLTQFIYMWDFDVEIAGVSLGAKPALDILLPIVSLDLDFSAPTPISADNGGVGDLLIGPALQFDPIMGEEGPIFVHRLETQFILPTGEYDSRDYINPGSNYFSFNPYWSATAWLTSKDTLSIRAHYLWNDKNDDPWKALGPGVKDTRAGQAFHINFALEHEFIEKKLHAGVNGYYLKQVTDAEVNGFDVAGSREQVLGIGPGAVWSFSQNTHLFANAYWETEVKNRPEGFLMNLRLVHKF